jgi:hypothetical protein
LSVLSAQGANICHYLAAMRIELSCKAPTSTSKRQMSSEQIVGYKRSAPDAPNTSDDSSQPKRGKKAEVAGEAAGPSELC